ncbi:UNVERIFIED_CONTAM: hypothetical protein GTU68_050366, partial [Idotea baltica]|nr:hypothetical protein [Idotea baltica]
LGGLFFAKKLRAAGYVTILDPLQDLFGRRWGSFLFVPALVGEILYSAAILAALGTTLSVMLNLDSTISIIVSAAIAVSYTLFGGLAAVAYTDVIQLFCIFFGLWLTIPFAINHEAVGSLSLNETDWVGSIESGSYEWGEWIDFLFLITLGGIPWQVSFQRILSARDPNQARMLTLTAALGCFVMVIPACIIGAIAKATVHIFTDWEATDFNRNVYLEEQSLILPLVIQHLTPRWVSYMGLGAVSAAVMSSADSSVLSSSSMFARNIYKNVIRLEVSMIS